MARYIDAEKIHDAIEAIQTSLGSNDDKIWRKNKLRYSGLAMARGVINDTPTADVVPKSEVDDWKEIAETYQKMFEDSYSKYQAKVDKLSSQLAKCKLDLHYSRKEVAREIHETIMNSIEVLPKSEIESKYGYIHTYTGGHPDPVGDPGVMGWTGCTGCAKNHEVAKIFKEILTIIRSYEFDALVAKENYGIILVRNFGTDILKLKKKYTGEKDDG